MKAIETPLSSPIGIMWCICDPTASSSCKMNAHSTDFGPRTQTNILSESLSEAWSHFKDLLQKVPHHSINLWLQVQIFYDYVNLATRRTINQSAGDKLRDKNVKESWALLEDLALYDNENWNDPRDFAKPVKAISLPQDVPSTSDRRLIELENQVQCLMEAHLAPKSSVQVNKIASSCEICRGTDIVKISRKRKRVYKSQGFDSKKG
ncbi:hypothetical protein Tco_1516467 [Tanacetum coccineum]